MDLYNKQNRRMASAAETLAAKNKGKANSQSEVGAVSDQEDDNDNDDNNE